MFFPDQSDFQHMIFVMPLLISRSVTERSSWFLSLRTESIKSHRKYIICYIRPTFMLKKDLYLCVWTVSHRKQFYYWYMKHVDLSLDASIDWNTDLRCLESNTAEWISLGNVIAFSDGRNSLIFIDIPTLETTDGFSGSESDRRRNVRTGTALVRNNSPGN